MLRSRRAPGPDSMLHLMAPRGWCPAALALLRPSALLPPVAASCRRADYQDRKIEGAADGDEKDGMFSGISESRSLPTRPTSTVAVHDQVAIASARSIHRSAEPSAPS